MHWMVCSVYYLGCMVVNISLLFGEWRITERDVTTFALRYCCLGFFLAWNPISILSCDGYFPGFGKYIFLQRQTCTVLVLSAEHTECSCSPNIVIFNNFLVFNFPFFKFRTIISFSQSQGKYSFVIFDVVLCYQLFFFNSSSGLVQPKIYHDFGQWCILASIFCTFQSFSYCKYKPFINSFQPYLFCYKCWLSYFSAI